MHASIFSTTASGVVKSMSASTPCRWSGARAVACGFSLDVSTRTECPRCRATSSTNAPVFPWPSSKRFIALRHRPSAVRKKIEHEGREETKSLLLATRFLHTRVHRRRPKECRPLRPFVFKLFGLSKDSRIGIGKEYFVQRAHSLFYIVFFDYEADVNLR